MTAKFSVAAVTTAAILALALGGCAGGSSQPSIPPASQNQTTVSNGTGSQSKVTSASTTTSVISVTGEIAGIYSSTEFLLETPQCGYEVVYTTNTTQINTNGSSIAKGTYAAVEGTGSCATAITATQIVLSTAMPTPIPTATFTLSGTIASKSTSSPFLLHTAQCGYEEVYYSSSTSITYNGYQFVQGTYATVTGTGSCATSVTATSIRLGTVGSTPSPDPSSSPVATGTTPSHIPTWAYDEYWAQGENATSAQVQAYVTYAEGGKGNDKAPSDCGASSSCSSVFYLNATLVYDCNSAFIAEASEEWYVHENGYTDSAHRLVGTYSQPCNGASSYHVYAANFANAGVQAYFENYLRQNADGWNYYFMDDTSGTVVDQFYGPTGGMCGGICYSTEEFPTNAAVVAGHGSFVAGMTHSNGSPMKFFYNGLSYDGATTPNDLDVEQSSGNFVGAACENCVVDNGIPVPGMYGDALNGMAEMDAIAGAQFIVLSNGFAAAGSASQIEQRLITIAIAWLGFSPGHTVVWENLEDNTNNLAVWPEEQLYPLQPVESMSTSSQDISVATGIYRREFAACYQKGTSIGPCAAIINATGSAVTVESSWLKQGYGHVVQLVGGDTLSGGSVSLTTSTFSANSTTVPPSQALLLVR
jgi:hypothetical protein